MDRISKPNEKVEKPKKEEDLSCKQYTSIDEFVDDIYFNKKQKKFLNETMEFYLSNYSLFNKFLSGRNQISKSMIKYFKLKIPNFEGKFRSLDKSDQQYGLKYLDFKNFKEIIDSIILIFKEINKN